MKMNKLKEYFLKDLYEISSGISTKPEQAGYGYPFISFRTIFNNWILPNKLNDLMNTSKIEREKYSIKKGDILLTRTSEKIDELAMSSVALKDYENTTFSGFAKRLRPIQTDITYDKFMVFFLRSPYFREIIDKKTTMTLRASFNETLFSQIKILLPEYKTQVKIGELLCKMEEKIKLNNKINSELENMAKTIYDYWFLQFEFPNNEGKPYKSSGGKMVWNEELKKEIPDNWEIKKLGQLIIENKKSSLQVSQIKNNSIGEIPFFTSGSTILYTSNYLVNGQNCFLNTGGNADVKNYYGKASYSTDTWCITSNEETIYYLSMYLLSMKNILDIKYFQGTGLKHLQKDLLKNTKIVYPNKLLLEKFNNLIKNLFIKSSDILRENQELTSLRDYLLPLLMNGQIGFKE